MTWWLKFQNWYYSTTLGGWYLEFLLWWDRKNDQPSYLSYRETQQIIRQYSLLDRGVTEMKGKINTLIRARTKEEYHEKLSEIENLISLAERDPDSPEGKFAEILRQTTVRKNNLGNEQDVITATDRARMIDTKIKAVYELQDHKVMRDQLRTIRNLRTEGKNEEADKLMKEWQTKYGKIKRK